MSVVAQQNRFMRCYREAQATSPGTAIAPEQLGIRRSWTFNRMVRARVFVHVGDGRYYLNLQAADEFRAYRRFKALIAVAILILYCLIYLLIRSH